MHVHLKFAIALIGLGLLTSCASTTTPGGATENELCVSWGKSLPTRSRLDTEQTAAEIQAAYSAFAAACPGHVDLIP